ncbi:hypothetical protein DMENIID0001_046910 [Sergentomyia squamirostris]
MFSREATLRRMLIRDLYGDIPSPSSSTCPRDAIQSASGFPGRQQYGNILWEAAGTSHFIPDGRSPLTSGDSDDSSGAESPAPPPPLTSTNNSHEKKTMLASLASSKPSQTPPKMSPPVIAPAPTTGGVSHQLQSGLGSVLYPAAALANLPQDVLLSLVQAGHLQFHSNDDGAHQYITIPLSTASGSAPPALAKLSSIKEESTANGRDSPIFIKKESIE